MLVCDCVNWKHILNAYSLECHYVSCPKYLNFVYCVTCKPIGLGGTYTPISIATIYVIFKYVPYVTEIKYLKLKLKLKLWLFAKPINWN